MKKILSALLVVTMIASVCAVFALPATAASGDFFDTHGKASHEVPGYDGDINSIPGYQYTKDGFQMTTADWTTGKPFSHVSTKDKVNLKDGFYMQVRVDEFNYAVYDKWLNFSIWSQPSIEEGNGDTRFGTGVQTLIRPADVKGTLDKINWYTHAFTESGSTSIDKDYNGKDDNGNNILTLVITYDKNSGYNVIINGSKAPDKVIEYMNETYETNSMAHIGFTMYTGSTGGSQSATILKYGDSEKTAVKPEGEGEKKPQNHIIEYAPIADPSTVPAGQPAVLMSGDTANSHLKGTPMSNFGSIISITEDKLVNVVTTKRKGDCGVWNVKNNTSYDIKDFPVIMVVVKNYCNEYVGKGECAAFEEASLILATGEEVVINAENEIGGVYPAGEKAYFINDDGYLVFVCDVSDELKNEDESEGRFGGRINALRFDLIDIDTVTPGANEFDVVMQGFFRTEEEAVAYAEDYFTSNGWKGHTDNGDNKETDTETDTETNTESGDETEAKTETQAPATNDNTATSGGCFGTVGFGAIAIVAVAAVAGFVTLKKKD